MAFRHSARPRRFPPAEATWLRDGHVVFGIIVNGESRAYPKRILAWHEMAIDRLGGVDLTIVYCTLCGTVIPYESRVAGRRFTFGTSGLLYRSNKLMFDEETRSLWSSLEGVPVVGALVDSGLQLPFHAVVTTTWGEWRQEHPATTVLSLETGYERNYAEGVAYRDYFATDRLMFEVPRADTRLKNKAEVLVLRPETIGPACVTSGDCGGSTAPRAAVEFEAGGPAVRRRHVEGGCEYAVRAARSCVRQSRAGWRAPRQHRPAMERDGRRARQRHRRAAASRSCPPGFLVRLGRAVSADRSAQMTRPSVSIRTPELRHGAPPRLARGEIIAPQDFRSAPGRCLSVPSQPCKPCRLCAGVGLVDGRLLQSPGGFRSSGFSFRLKVSGTRPGLKQILSSHA